MALIPDSLAYQLLKAVSHSKNLKISDQITEGAEQDMHHAREPALFLEYIGKYLDYRAKSVIDVGCGTGDLCIVLAKSGAHRVVGVDLNQDRIAAARRKAASENVEDIVAFKCADLVEEYQAPGAFDVAFSQSAFEHILSPLDCLEKIYACLSEGGVLGTIFGPLWFSPYGAHMRGFTPVPWVQFLFQERAVLRVRTERFRPDEPVARVYPSFPKLSPLTKSSNRRRALCRMLKNLYSLWERADAVPLSSTTFWLAILRQLGCLGLATKSLMTLGPIGG